MRDLRSLVVREDRGICHVVAAVVTGVAGIGAAAIGANAESSAANKANKTLQAQQAQTRADLLPYNQGGQNDFAAYNALLGQGPGGSAQQQATLQSMPGYQFQLQQGLKATQNSAAARGLGVSGAALKGAATYASGLANSNYGTYANNLMSGANLGENAAAQTGALGTQSAIAQGNNTTAAGTAQAAGATAAANGLSSGLTNLYLFNALQGGGSGASWASGGAGINGNLAVQPGVGAPQS